MKRQRLLVIACPVFQRELETLASRAATDSVVRFLDMGLHEGSAGKLREALQTAIDVADAESFDAIGLAYGLCNLGVLGLQARRLPLVIPRAHDCIGVLLGTSGYLAQLDAQPGTYFQSAGWLEHPSGNGELRVQNVALGPASNVTREQLIEKYGEDNAEYLLEQLARLTRYYQRLAFIRTPVPGVDRWEARAREIAARRAWKFESLPGDLEWLQRLLDGQWTGAEFLVVSPGHRVIASPDARLIACEPT